MDMLVLEYTNHAIIDLIECTESEKEEVEETDADEFSKFADLSTKTFKQHNIQYHSPDLKLFKLFLDCFTPPPEIPSC